MPPVLGPVSKALSGGAGGVRTRTAAAPPDGVAADEAGAGFKTKRGKARDKVTPAADQPRNTAAPAAGSEPEEEAWDGAADDASLAALAAEHGLRLDAQSLDRLCRAFGLGARLGWKAFDGEGGSLRLLLSTERGEYELRGSPGDPGRLALEAELAIAAFLRKRSFPAQELLPAVSGAGYVKQDGAWYVLERAVAGQPYDESDAQAIAAGRSLARYHTLITGYQGPRRLGTTRFQTDQVDECAAWLRGMHRFSAAVRPDQLGALASVFSDALLRVAALKPRLQELYDEEPRLLAHGSFDRAALRFNDDAVVSAGCFSRTAYDVRLVDVARACVSFCCTAATADEIESPLARRLYRQFLAAYDNSAGLTRCERQALPALIEAARIFGFVGRCRGLFDAASPEGTEGLVRSIEDLAERLRVRADADAECLRAD